MNTDPSPAEGAFHRLYTGRLFGLMSWDRLADFWQRIDPAAGWYLYAVGETPPASASDASTVQAFVAEIDALLRREHEHDYCGIVYADDLQTPGFVKIYDPNDLGVSCGFSTNPPLPGWIMSRVAPEDLKAAAKPAARRRWWRSLLGRA